MTWRISQGAGHFGVEAPVAAEALDKKSL